MEEVSLQFLTTSRLKSPFCILKTKVLQIEISIALVALMETLYKKNALPGFDDRDSDEENIDELSIELTKVLY